MPDPWSCTPMEYYWLKAAKLHTAVVSMKKTRETKAFLKYQCSPFGLGILPWDVLKLEKCPETESSMSHHMGLMPSRGSSLSSFTRQISLDVSQAGSFWETVQKKDEDRQMSSSSLLICSLTALSINVSMSVKQRDCTLFCKVMWKYLQDMDVVITEYAEMSWHLAILASSSWDQTVLLNSQLDFHIWRSSFLLWRATSLSSPVVTILC